ncbi:unnamed protein product [Rotaria sp. Silwood2]|nr:unnamed protein product [Rotaria sp. Silwood2]
MFMKFGDVQYAEQLFEMMKKKDIVTYGAMMKGYVENNMSEKALDLFEQIPFSLNDVCYIVIFNACVQLLNDCAKQIGTKLLELMPKHFYNNNVLITSVIDMLMKFGDVTTAEHFFQMNKKKILVTYRAMMNGYNINNEPLKCFQLLEEIKEHGFILDEIVSIIVISACTRLSMRSICQSIIDHIPSHIYNNQRIRNSLIHVWVCIHCLDS